MTWIAGTQTGCYYGQLAAGQWRLLWHREPIEQLLDAPDTPEELRRRLALVEAVRIYGREIGLDVGRQYTSYVPWPGDRVITTLVATRPGEVDAAGFTFPVLGRLPYKGYFDRAAAEREARELRRDGLDVCVSPVRAYSTLGWFADPLTEPMLLGGDLQLVETILHELVHSTIYVAGDADFNESVANFIGKEATARFLEDAGLLGDPRTPSELARLQRERTARGLALANRLISLRASVSLLYAREPASPVRDRDRAELVAAAREDLATLAPPGISPEQFARRFDLGDACLALRATYGDDLEQHRARFDALDGDLGRFIERLIAAAREPDPRSAFFTPTPSTPR